VISILGPWLLLVLLLVGPAALLIVFVLAFVFLAAAFAALVALLASPYLLVRHLRARHRAPRRAFAFLRRPAAAPVAGEHLPQAATRAPLAA
jgi:4-hydroxybenzoate polyprenyltransferase